MPATSDSKPRSRAQAGRRSTQVDPDPARHSVNRHAGPGPTEIIDAVRQSIVDFDLDLTGKIVLAGAGDGFHTVTAVAAAMAGAGRVIVLASEPKKHMPTASVFWNPAELAAHAGVSERLEIVGRIHHRDWQEADILVNSSKIGPISRSIVEQLRPLSVVALMAEPWELRPATIDLNACSEMHVKVVAPNLSHPSIAMLPDLAQLCCRLVEDAGIDIPGANIALLCDTPCAPHLEQAFVDRGAKVTLFQHPVMLPHDGWSAIVVALRPSEKSSMDINGLARVCETARGSILVQFSGDIDRVAARYFGLRIWPARKPMRGQLGLPAEAYGWNSAIRRLVGGLKAAHLAQTGTELRGDDVGFLVAR